MYENTWIINPYMMQVFEVWRNRYYKELYTPQGWMECVHWIQTETSKELSQMIDISEVAVKRWLIEAEGHWTRYRNYDIDWSPFTERNLDYEFIWFFMLLFTSVENVFGIYRSVGEPKRLFVEMQIRLARIMYEEFSQLNTLDWSPLFKNIWLIDNTSTWGEANYRYFIEGRDSQSAIENCRWGNVGWNYDMLERMLDGIRCAREPDGSCQTSLDFTYSIFCIYKNEAQSLNTGTLSLEDFQRSSNIWAPLIGYNISWYDLVNTFRKTCQRLTRPSRPALNYPGGIE